MLYFRIVNLRLFDYVLNIGICNDMLRPPFSIEARLTPLLGRNPFVFLGKQCQIRSDSWPLHNLALDKLFLQCILIEPPCSEVLFNLLDVNIQTKGVYCFAHSFYPLPWHTGCGTGHPPFARIAELVILVFRKRSWRLKRLLPADDMENLVHSECQPLFTLLFGLSAEFFCL